MLDSIKFRAAHKQHSGSFADPRNVVQAIYEQYPEVYDLFVRYKHPALNTDSLDLLHTYEELAAHMGMSAIEVRRLLRELAATCKGYVYSHYDAKGAQPEVSTELIDKLPTKAAQALRRSHISNDYKLRRWMASPYSIPGLGEKSYNELCKLAPEYNLPKFSKLEPRHTDKWLLENYEHLAESTDYTLNEILAIRDRLFGANTYIIEHVSPELRETLIQHQATSDLSALHYADGILMSTNWRKEMRDELREVCAAKYKYLR